MLPKEYHDFRVAAWLIWKRIGLPEPTPIQYDMANFLQFGGPKVFITAFRGAAKSYLTSAYTCWSHSMSDHWQHGCDCDWCMKRPDVNGVVRARDLRFRVVSAAGDKVREFINFSKRIITEVDEFNELRPRSADKTWAQDRFDIEGSPIAQVSSVVATGIFGTLTGGRANEICWDDVETPNTSETVGMRQKLRNRMTEFSALLIPEYHRQIGLGTPQCEESIVDEMADKGYVVRAWPISYPTKDEEIRWGDRLAPMLRSPAEDQVGKSVEPTRFSDMHLAEVETDMGKSNYRLQMHLDTSLSDALKFPLKLGDLVIMDVDQSQVPDHIVWASGPDQIIKDMDPLGFTGDYFHRPMKVSDRWAELKGGVMFVDPSGAGSDETAYAIVKEACGTLFCTDLDGYLGGYEEPTLRALALAAKMGKVSRILVEQNFGQGMFASLLRPIVMEVFQNPDIGDYVANGCTIEEIRSTGQKELRVIDTLEPLMNQHRLVVDRGVFIKDRRIRQGVAAKDQLAYRLGYQITRITKERNCLKHDDRVEALAGACQYWVQSMAKHRGVSAIQERRAQQEADWQAYRKELEELGTPHWKMNKPKTKSFFSNIVKQRHPRQH